MRWFSRKKRISKSKVEQKFQVIVDLIKDLDRKEFNRLKEGIDLAWQAYNKVSQAKTSLEKEIEDIDLPERILEEESARDK